jgi:hypothetical protein
VDDRVEVFMPEGGKVDKRNAAIAWFRMPLPAIDCDRESARGQPCGKLFCEGFESAIVSRNPTRPENCDPVRLLNSGSWLLDSASAYPLAALDRASARPDGFGLLARLLTGL